MKKGNTEDKGRRFFFGKYRGRYVKDVIMSDIQYITWTMKNVEWFWYNRDEIDLYKRQLLRKAKPKNQYEMVMNEIRSESEGLDGR